MTSAAPPAPPAQATPPALEPPGRLAGFGRLMLAEWTKIRSVRSTLWTLLLFVVVTLGLTALLTWLTVHAVNQGKATGRAASIVADPTSFILGTGLGLGQLAICVLGVLVITSEYSTGTIRASLLAVPKRLPMLAAKAAVFSLLVLIVGEVVAFGSFFLGSALARSLVKVSLGDPNVTRAVVGAGLYLTVLGLFALAIGNLIRHTAGAITAVIGLVLVIGPLLALLPYSWGAHVHEYFPTVAGVLITGDHQQPDQLLSPWQGFGVFCLWTALLLAAGAYLLKRRDT